MTKNQEQTGVRVKILMLLEKLAETRRWCISKVFDDAVNGIDKELSTIKDKELLERLESIREE